MNWLSKTKFVIVCHEKVVRIPLEGDEILRVHGEGTQGVVKTLMNIKERIRHTIILETCIGSHVKDIATYVSNYQFCLRGEGCNVKDFLLWSPVLWAAFGKSSLTGLELVQETTNKVVLVKEKSKAVSPWESVVPFGKKGKLAPRYVGPFKILERIGLAAYRLRLPEEVIFMRLCMDTFHVSNLKKCLADASLHVPLDEIKVDKTLHFVKKAVEIMDQ
ncbi:hypothetical protein Tco_0828202 [Tanacetum coccineum]